MNRWAHLCRVNDVAIWTCTPHKFYFLLMCVGVRSSLITIALNAFISLDVWCFFFFFSSFVSFWASLRVSVLLLWLLRRIFSSTIGAWNGGTSTEEKTAATAKLTACSLCVCVCVSVWVCQSRGALHEPIIRLFAPKFLVSMSNFAKNAKQCCR